MDNHELRATASRALSLLDLTNLKDDCTPEAIDALCDKAHTAYGDTAAICIWPRFVAQARARLGAGNSIRIATVVNFPGGDLDIATVVTETRQAVADGADDIDLVIPYRFLLQGNEDAVSTMVSAIKAECPEGVILKVILETGELRETGLMRRASELAIAAGADFIKTSTGKVSVNATLEAADVMLQAIRDSSRGRVGFKPAGGISSVADARLYLKLADTIMGEDWVMPSTFRFGASGLLDDILAVLANGNRVAQASGY